MTIEAIDAVDVFYNPTPPFPIFFRKFLGSGLDLNRPESAVGREGVRRVVFRRPARAIGGLIVRAFF